MARWTLSWLAARNIAAGRVIDWGCGEGAAARIFAESGWLVTGIDSSRAMLELARARASSAHMIEWIEHDLRAPVFVQPATLATAYYDTLNYLISEDDVRAAMATIASALLPGAFVFADVNTPYEYATNWDGRHLITADTDDLLVFNRLRYSAESRLARGRIVWFARENNNETWRRGSETHIQRAHTDREITAAIDAAGLTLVERCTPTGDVPTASATRIVYIARK